MRVENHQLWKELERRAAKNEAAAHFASFIQYSEDKDAATDEVRQLMINTAGNAVSLLHDLGLVAHDAFYPEETKQLIEAARRLAHEDTSTAWFSLRRAAQMYEQSVLDLPPDPSV